MASRGNSSILDFHVVGYRVRERRKDLGLTTQQVADLAGVARYTLVRLENGSCCHRSTLDKIRKALHLFTDQMVRPLDDPITCAVQRGTDLQWTVSKQKAGYQKQIVDEDPLHVNSPSDRKRLGTLGLQPFFTAVFGSVLGQGLTSQALMELHQPSWVDQHAGEEFVYCLRGPVTISVSGVPQRLEQGDAVCFDAKLPHQYEPSEKIDPKELPALILVVVTKDRVNSKGKTSSHKPGQSISPSD